MLEMTGLRMESPKIDSMFPMLVRARNLMQDEPDYDGTMTPAEFRVYMNGKTGLGVSEHTGVEIAALQWLEALRA